ncbi:N-acetylmuramoyl-L-alanine amidase [Rhodobacter veldkampii DSM 11550]|uniref:N-acetylmuramoyl-L-alanine amidase n=1 Tax=Phaeovulum veldkampii DSM 11550 TaxID=1185920 RepID=A0A2T4JKT6_9RHOB|nr:N-acetylmuramoyl-L-alanine amidase [Phaeovulum veldkampii]MBK5947443.1 N-acetylmuramoyl-L-alanine amidase [Phaeovulum veldkampii DSM 11550]PTE18516.1 N-acetylmuramoyl-L-alanine amidase [Phaeovulum veldkampii DSM 11550]TDQ59204.1 N-acetylmuramoyl-L-alanine amidase [Phaeovulum veldkampii DSM 11550]
MICWARYLLAALVLGLALVGGAPAQDRSALARLEPVRSAIVDEGRGIAVDLGLSQPVPWRVYLLDAPPRLVMDFREVDFSAARSEALEHSDRVVALRWGPIRPGWSRLVAELSGPFNVTLAEARTEDEALVRVRLAPASPEDFAARTGAPASALWDLPQPAPVDAPRRRQTGAEALKIVLDPGHGGIDPGAEADGVSEAVLVLTFARDLQDRLRRAGMRVVMTREENVFVPLETRMSVARAAGADLFLSLHADALAEGEAAGATVYLLAEEASEAAAQRLAERHDRADLLAGVDLEGHDDEVAAVLMELARAETAPRSQRLALALEGAIKGAGLKMHKRAIQAAEFSVLKSPDIPSVLLELGFMSSAADRARLIDPVWRGQMADAIVAAIALWARGDAAEAQMIRQ